MAASCALTGAEDDAGRIGALNDILTGSESGDARPAVLAAIGRNGRLARGPEIQAAIREPACPRGCRRRLLPVLGRPEFTRRRAC